MSSGRKVTPQRTLSPSRVTPLLTRIPQNVRQKMWFDPDGTMLVEVDVDGVPLGQPSTTRFSHADGASPVFLVLAAWGLLLFGSLYAASDVREAVIHNQALASNPSLVTAAQRLYDFAQMAGPARLREHLDGMFAALKHDAPDGDPAWETKGRTINGRGEPPRILIVGASSMQYYLGAELERGLEQYREVTTYRFGKLGTGLARPDVFDWPAHIEKLLGSFRPNVVLAQFGGNDGQPFTLPSGELALFGTDSWVKEYSTRVRALVKTVHASGATLFMLGMPVTRSTELSQKFELINRITERETTRSGGYYLSTWDIAADAEGRYRSTVRHGAKSGAMYLGDGIHYARLGAAYVAQRICWRLEPYLGLIPADSSSAVAVRGELRSAARGQTASYLAFVPQPAFLGGEKLPALYLLHGAGASWTDFSSHAHDVLQRLAAQHRVVLVVPDADAEGWYVDSPRKRGSQIQTYLMQELIPSVEARLPISGRRAIAGLSMGGNGALVLSLKHPGKFVAVSSLSGTVDLSEAKARGALVERLGPYAENRELWERDSAIHLVRSNAGRAKQLPVLLTVGAADRWAPANRALHAALKELGGSPVYKETPGDHSWDHWVAMLPEHVAWHAGKLHP